MTRRAGLFLAVGLFACGGTPEVPDAASGADGGSAICTSDHDCDDGHFCSGMETCAPHDPSADAHGCVTTIACPPEQRCDEMNRRCATSCAVAADADHDGFDAVGCGGADCDDTDPHRFPGNAEVCDDAGHDEDCDGSTFGMRDGDGDGYVSAACCNTPMTGAATCGPDCDDMRRDAHPGATEACEGIDNDCDTAIDEGLLVPQYPDMDFDLHGASGASSMICPGAPGWSTVSDDCDDTSPLRFGTQLEICDSVDNDCDGMVDEAPASIPWYPDADNDQFGTIPTDPMQIVVSCSPVAGHSPRSSDCDDHDAQVHPGARELCNGHDDDCNGYADAVGTGAGDTEDDDADGIADVVCGGSDCNDAVASIHPMAMELCNGLDDDCDGVVDGASAMAEWYLDLDHDGFGDASGPPIMSCDPQPGRVPIGGDCDDTSASVHPRAADPCDDVDEDCDGRIDETGIRFAFFPDADGDHFGTTDRSAVVFRCTAPAGTSAASGDCADTDAMIHPGATEQCNTRDDDCDTTVDEDSTHDWFADADHDGHGAGAPINTCMAPAGRVAVGDDCDDGNGAVYPGNAETCNGRDDDCDGMSDDPPLTGCSVVANATGTCAAGRCTLSCSAGYGDCDGTTANGCEVSTSSTALYCGSCTNACHAGDTCGATPGTCDRSPFVQLTGLDTSVLAVRASGGVAAWGDGASALTTFATNLPQATTTALTGILHVDVGLHGHACALTMAHTVLCWGGVNDDGELGDGGVNGHGPLPVPGLSNVVSVSAGYNHSCAVLADGSAWCWGANLAGQLGDGTTTARHVPTRVLVVSDAVEITAGDGFTCARRGTSGAYYVTCWGTNLYGAIGVGTSGGGTPNVTTPNMNAGGLPGDVAGFSDQTTGGVCVRTSDGRAFCWGNNSVSQLQLGLGTIGTSVPTPTQVPGLSGVQTITLGNQAGCAIVRGASTNELWCWGSGSSGVGIWINALTTNQFAPVRVTGVTNPVAVTCGNTHFCAANVDGSVQCVGTDGNGQLGDGPPLAYSSAVVSALALP